MIFGYARASNDGQSVNAQVKALRAAEAEKNFRETASDRSQTRRALDGLGRLNVWRSTISRAPAAV